MKSDLLVDLYRGVMVKAMDCGIVVSEFELQSLFHFRTNTLGIGRTPPYPSSFGLNSTPWGYSRTTALALNNLQSLICKEI